MFPISVREHRYGSSQEWPWIGRVARGHLSMDFLCLHTFHEQFLRWRTDSLEWFFHPNWKRNKRQHSANKNWTRMKLDRPTRLHAVVPICRHRICANWIFDTVISSADRWVYSVALKRMGRSSHRSSVEFRSIDGDEDAWIDECTRFATHDSLLIRRNNSRRLYVTWCKDERNDSVNTDRC